MLPSAITAHISNAFKECIFQKWLHKFLDDTNQWKFGCGSVFCVYQYLISSIEIPSIIWNSTYRKNGSRHVFDIKMFYEDAFKKRIFQSKLREEETASFTAKMQPFSFLNSRLRKHHLIHNAIHVPRTRMNLLVHNWSAGTRTTLYNVKRNAFFTKILRWHEPIKIWNRFFRPTIISSCSVLCSTI